MTKLLEKALDAVRRLSPGAQDEIARTMLDLAADNGDPEPVEPSHLGTVLQGLQEASRGELASDEAVEAAFRRFDS